MEFDKVSEQNAWDAVDDTTQRVRKGDISDPALVEWFRSRGVEIERAVFPCLCLFDEGVYSGTLISHDRHVFEYFVDLAEPDDGDFDDVTSELGPKDPNHPESDVKDLITMSLVYYDNQIGQAA